MDSLENYYTWEKLNLSMKIHRKFTTPKKEKRPRGLLPPIRSPNPRSRFPACGSVFQHQTFYRRIANFLTSVLMSLPSTPRTPIMAR